jgi:predicted ATP-grasp superfamily ATP-dependent carboligase
MHTLTETGRAVEVSSHPAVVLGGGVANGLGITRNLGSLGIPVYCLTSNAKDLMCFSKYCRNYAIVPDIERDVPTLRRVLDDLRLQLPDTAVLFPTTDTALLTVAQLQDELDGYVTALPDRALVETMVIKSRFYASLRQWKVPHPRTWYPEQESWTQLADQLRFPVFVRPAQSRAFAADFQSKGFVAHTLQETQFYLHQAQEAGHSMMLQEIIPGPPTSEYAIRGYLNTRSQPIVLMAIQRIRSLKMFQPRPVMRSIPLAEVAEFAQVILTYLRNIQYSGLFIAEFKRDPRDGICKLFEINARSGGDNDFLRACGANHILAAYQEALGEAMKPTTTYESGRYNIVLKFDIRQNLQRLVQGDPFPQILTPYMNKKKWRSLSRDDPLPFFADLFTVFL